MELEPQLIAAGHVLLSRGKFEVDDFRLIAVTLCDSVNRTQRQGIEPPLDTQRLRTMLVVRQCRGDSFVEHLFPADEIWCELSAIDAILQLALNEPVQAIEIGIHKITHVARLSGLCSAVGRLAVSR